MISNLYALHSLSLWEIGLRCHGLDPDAENETTISVEVRNTLRMLMWAMSTHLNIQNKDGNELRPMYIPFFKIFRDHPVDVRLRSDVATRTIEKSFLDTVFIDKDEFEYWHLIENWPVPEFWFRCDEVEYHNEQRGNAFRRAEGSSVLGFHAPIEDTTAVPAKRQQSEAASQRHAERNKICDQFAQSLSPGLTRKEVNDAGVDFYMRLTESQKLELARSPSEYRQTDSAKRIANGVRTLIRAKNRICKPQDH
jgi:hypothetical protein